MDSVEVRLATARDRDRVVETVVAAFEDEPAFRFFFPQRALYTEQAPALVGHLFDQRLAFDTVWVVDGGSAVAMWNPPREVNRAISFGVSPDALERMDRYDAVVHEILPAQPHWYLGVLATHPQHVGKRWGRLVMERGLERAHQDHLPACLETTTQKNVGIYSASGWQVHDTATFDTFQVRVMVTRQSRDPQVMLS